MKTLLNHNEAKFIDSIISSIPKSIQFSKIKEANKEFIVSDPNNADKLRDFFIEKRLPDGRGLRLNRDYTFKGFIE